NGSLCGEELRPVTTGDTGKSVDDERDSAGSVVARKRSSKLGGVSYIRCVCSILRAERLRLRCSAFCTCTCIPPHHPLSRRPCIGKQPSCPAHPVLCRTLLPKPIGGVWQYNGGRSRSENTQSG